MVTKSTTTTQSPDDLRQQADDLRRQADEAQDAVRAVAEQEQRRQWERQLAADQVFVDGYDKAALNQAVDDARRTVDQTVADMPVVQAMANYLAAQWRRNHAHVDLASARSRLGLPAAEVIPAPVDDERTLHEYVTRAATTLAAEQIATERADTAQG